MKIHRCVVLIGFFIAGSLTWADSITTTYLEANDYTDFEFRDRSDEKALRSFDRELKESSRIAKLIGEGRALHLEFLDIDLAGEILPSARVNEVRVIRKSFPPKLHIRYSFKDSEGTILQSGEAKLSSLDFLNNLRRSMSTEQFFYELALIEEWLNASK